MSSPLVNSIRSFWTPEESDDPDFLRLIRQDKIATATALIASALAVLGLVACAVSMVVTLAR